MCKRIQISTLLLFISITGHSQLTNNETYGLRSPGKDITKTCKDFYTALSLLPKEVRASPKIIGDSVFMILPDPIWINSLITSKKDGLAIDLVSKELFSCDNTLPFAKSPIHTGYLLPPKNKNEIEKKHFFTPMDI